MSYVPLTVPINNNALPEYLIRELRKISNELVSLKQQATSPAALAAGNNNDVNLGDNPQLIRVTTNAAGSTLTGIAARDTRFPVYLVNLGSGSLVLKHASASSAAANRFALASSTDTTLAVGGCAILIYDAVSARWRQLDRAS